MAEPPLAQDREVNDALLQRQNLYRDTSAGVTAERQEAEDRSWIAKRIIQIFVGAVAAVLILLLLQGVLKGEWSTVASQAADLIKTAVLPIVTLVLGFYFGSRTKG